MKVIFAPEVENDLFELVEILVRKGYLGTYEFAQTYWVKYIANNHLIAQYL